MKNYKDFYEYENLESFNPDMQISRLNFYEVPIPKSDPIIITIDLSLSYLISVKFDIYQKAIVYFSNARPGYLYLIKTRGRKIFWKNGNNIYLRQGTTGKNHLSEPCLIPGYPCDVFPPNGLSLLACSPRDNNSVYLDCLLNIWSYNEW